MRAAPPCRPLRAVAALFLLVAAVLAVPDASAWATWFGTNASCAGPYTVPVEVYGAELGARYGNWTLSKPFPLAPLLLSDVGGMWDGLSVDHAGARVWQTWCLQDGTVLLQQFSFTAAGPVVDGMCQIPYIVEGITYFDARVNTRGPFMFVNGQIIAFWLTNASSTAAPSTAPLRAHARPERGGYHRMQWSSHAGSEQRMAAFLGATPVCSTANISTFENFYGSWMMRFDGGMLAKPTALTFSDAESYPTTITVTAYDVLTGAVTWTTPAMPHNGSMIDFAWAVWGPRTLLVAGTQNWCDDASVVVLGSPAEWAVNASSASLASLAVPGAWDGTCSFTSTWEAPTGGLPMLAQQISDTYMSCQTAQQVSAVAMWNVTAFKNTGAHACTPTPSRVITCPSTIAGSTCVTPLLHMMAPAAASACSAAN